MSTRTKGCDVSHWQNANMQYPGDFVIVKATEGNGYKDSAMLNHANAAVEQGKVLGFYHFARPDLNNSAEEEARWFVKCVKPWLPCILVLDWEAKAVNYPAEWTLDFMREVYRLTGIRPLFYASSAVVKTGKYAQLFRENYGLWIAHWNVDEPDISGSGWKFWAIWQTGIEKVNGQNVDTNVFSGNLAHLEKYACTDFDTIPDASEKETISVGDVVKVNTRYDYSHIKNAAWVLNRTFDVMEKKGNRVVIGYDGMITGAWREEDLTKC